MSYNTNVEIINSRKDDYISTVGFIAIKVLLLKAILVHFVHIIFIRRRMK